MGDGGGHEVLRVALVAERLASRADAPGSLLDTFRTERRARRSR